MGADPPADGGYGDLEAKPSAAGQVFAIFWINRYFNATAGPHFARVRSHLNKLDF